MSRFIVQPSDRVFDALHDAGLIDARPENVRRCVIDLRVGEAARVYLETFADNEKLLAGLTAGLEPKPEKGPVFRREEAS